MKQKRDVIVWQTHRYSGSGLDVLERELIYKKATGRKGISVQKEREERKHVEHMRVMWASLDGDGESSIRVEARWEDPVAVRCVLRSFGPWEMESVRIPCSELPMVARGWILG